MNVYSIEVKLCATAYIKAESEEEAEKIARANFGETCCGDLPIGEYGDPAISDKSYENPDLPDISLSPAVTFYGPYEGKWDLDLVHEGDDEEEDEDLERCDQCGEKLEPSQIGLCDDCQERDDATV